MKAVHIATLLLFLHFPAVALAAELTPHEQELLRAQVEDLVGRLARTAPIDRVSLPERLAAGLVVRTTGEEQRSFAGVTVERAGVSLQGSSEQLFSWLSVAQRSGLAVSPPVRLRADGVQPVTLEARLWSAAVGKNGLDIQATPDELARLRDNLLWLEKQQEGQEAVFSLLGALTDAECVQVLDAEWREGRLAVTARALDEPARVAFEAVVRERNRTLPRRAKLAFAWRKPPSRIGRGKTTLVARGLAPSDAVLLASEVGRIPVVFASRGEAADLSVTLDADTGRTLFARLIERMGKQHGWVDDVLVIADRLPGRPPGALSACQRAVDLFFHRAPPGDVLILLADICRLSLIPPAESDRRLSLLLPDISPRKAAPLILWASGLEPAGSPTLLAALPAGASRERTAGTPGPRITVESAGAPLSELVRALAGLERVEACPAFTRPVMLRVRNEPRDQVLRLLLRANGAELVSGNDGRHGALQPAPGGPACDPAGVAKRPGEPGLRLLAVVRSASETTGLIVEGGAHRWVRKGQRLADGSEVRRIQAHRMLVRGSDRKLTSLALQPMAPGDCPQGKCPGGRDLSAFALAGLRLAGTARLGKRAAAVVMDPGGRSHLVRPGHLLGRRCARVVAIEPDALLLSLGCRRVFDPEKIRMIMEASIDSGEPRH